MSLLLEYIEKHPKETKRVIGIDYEQLQQLFIQAEALHHQKQAEIEGSKFRLNSKGAGCKPKLSLPDQMLLNERLFITASHVSISGCSIWS